MDTPDSDFQEILNKLDPDSRLAAIEFDLGKSAEEFMNSPLGRTVVGMAQQDYVDSLIALSNVAWWRRRRIQELQNRAAQSRQFCAYLQELIIKGRQAAQLLSSQEPN